MASKRNSVLRYGKDKYDASPDYPWDKFPNYAVLRKGNSDKWFALIMDVPKDRLGLPGDGVVDVVDIKCDPHEVSDLQKKDGYLPAYHMNKEHWVTVLLDGTVSLDEVKHRIDKSYALTP